MKVINKKCDEDEFMAPRFRGMTEDDEEEFYELDDLEAPEEIGLIPPEEEYDASEEEKVEDSDEAEAVAEEESFFDSDHITTYLREVSEYVLLTPEREIELAAIIREGQNALMKIIEEEGKSDPYFRQVYTKIQRLHAKEKTFPGMRDKILKVIRRSVVQALEKNPENEHYREIYRRVQEILTRIDEAKNEMVKGNLRLVLSIAKRYRGRGMSFDDLIQEGNLGLLKAVGRFDHTKGNRFSTYATWWVRQSIIRGIYDKTRTIRLPVHFIEMRNLYQKVYSELYRELGREPTPEEVAERANIPVERIETIMALTGQPVSLETPVGDDEQRLGDFIEDTRVESPAENIRDKELYEVLRRVLATLQPREERILRLRFGINGNPEETLEKIGKSFNVSKERIRQIEKKALQKLQHPKRRALLEPFLD
ncbi:RNA polymerase sigma factor RpoD/SigA [Thermodesulforhabdus norvegica]|uniref:RNA polymerase primary sigma factor n=1 Tax=Thermodesulforhabdus norvegica TaxID=39841 RepID=A0A1I4T8I9_9BACT|nr:RNA polymerase sigma factor RpoD/SigA [Thermodesulforhabdus norvegica]SFM73108.1 RNA polymerase primary sigma factor [Thermodesulforhabdus norvegica]